MKLANQIQLQDQSQCCSSDVSSESFGPSWQSSEFPLWCIVCRWRKAKMYNIDVPTILSMSQNTPQCSNIVSWGIIKNTIYSSRDKSISAPVITSLPRPARARPPSSGLKGTGWQSACWESDSFPRSWKPCEHRESPSGAAAAQTKTTSPHRPRTPRSYKNSSIIIDPGWFTARSESVWSAEHSDMNDYYTRLWAPPVSQLVINLQITVPLIDQLFDP